MKINDLLYSSQWDPDASASRNDCGPASLRMVLNTYGEPITTNDITAELGNPQGYTTFPDLIQSAKNHGYTGTIVTQSSPAQLKQYIDAGYCPLVVVHYGDLSSRQDQAFSGPHIVVVRGYRDDGYFVNDPNFFGPYRADGNNHFYTKDEFEQAWVRSVLDGNIMNTLLVIFPKENKTITMVEVDSNKYAELVLKATQWDTVAPTLQIDKMDATGGEKFNRALGMLDTAYSQVKDRNGQLEEENKVLRESVNTLTIKLQQNTQKIIDLINTHNSESVLSTDRPVSVSPPSEGPVIDLYDQTHAKKGITEAILTKLYAIIQKIQFYIIDIRW